MHHVMRLRAHSECCVLKGEDKEMTEEQCKILTEWVGLFEGIENMVEAARTVSVPELLIAQFEAHYYRELYGQWQDEAWRLRALIPGEAE